MPVFSVGDRVRYVGGTSLIPNGNHNPTLMGTVGTVTHLSPWNAWETASTGFVVHIQWDIGSYWNVLQDQIMLDPDASPHWKVIKRIKEIDNRRKTLGYSW